MTSSDPVPAPSNPTKRRAPRGWRSRILRWAGIAFVVGLLAAVTLPWWMGGMLALVTPLRGFSVQRYERIGYSRFALHGVAFNRSGVKVTLDRAEADTPLLWLWKRVGHGTPRIAGSRWEVVVDGSTPPASNTEPATKTEPLGWLSLRALLGRIATQLTRWLPDADVGPGRVRWVGGELGTAAATWKNRTLTVTQLTGAGWRTDATLSFSGTEDLLHLVARSPETFLAGQWDSRGPAVAGELRWRDQPVRIDAVFGERGWFPASATLGADAWRLPGATANVGELYDSLQGAGRIEWKDSRLTAELEASGSPVAGSEAPPLEVRLGGEGNLEAFRVGSFQVQIPGVTAQLSAPVTIGRDGRITGENAQFVLLADLAQLPWGRSAGKVDGRLRLGSDLEIAPAVDFEISTRDLKVGEWELLQTTASGHWEWPRLQVTRAELVPAEGERVVATGGWDVSKREAVDATVSGELRRGTLARWLPAGLEFNQVSFDGKIAGPWPALRHSGSASAEGVVLKNIKPFAVKAAWAGIGVELDSLTASAAAGTSVLTAGGKLAADRFRFDRLDLVQAGSTRLELQAPAELRWSPGLAMESLRLRNMGGGDLSLRFASGPAGAIEAQAHGISSAWLQDLLDLPGPAWELAELGVATTWDRGPVSGSVLLGGSVHLDATRSIDLAVNARSDTGGWRIERFNASESGSPVVNASGRIGLALRMDEAPLVRLNDNAPLQLDLTAAPNASFWAQLRDLSGLDLREPEATAKVTGTWTRPEGDLRVRAARVALDGKLSARPLPLVEGLDLQAVGDAGGITVRRLALQVEGQAANATGRLVVPAGGWTALWNDPLTALRRDGEGEINLPEADLARLARLAPEYLAPQGRLAAQVKVLPGGNLGGWMEVTDAASRPIGPLGAFREVNFRVGLSAASLKLENARATLGGQPVTLSGDIGMPTGEPLRFDVALKAENVPLARQTGLLLRGDLDLRLQSPAGAVPQIGGTVTLRDSLFLSDLRSLLASGPRGSSRPPPYFAVETPGLRDWQLAVAIRGTRFLKLRTALFAGVASARFQLGGTLGVPWATGEATVEEGRLTLPFATFDVKQGKATLSAADPYEPQLAITGTSRSHGFDVRLETSGAASDPILQFSSNPPLSSEQLLLLVMTGVYPRPETATVGRPNYASLGTFLGRSLLNDVTGGRVDSDRLTLVAGGEVSQLGRETYEVEYELNKRLSLLGEYDEFDNFNAGLRWRLFSRGGTKDDEQK